MARFHLLLATLVAALFAATGGAANSYTLFHDYVPETFFDNFTFFSGQGDPTHGTVNYLSSRKEAVSKQLIGHGTADDGTTTVKIAVDATNKLYGNAGRNSIRITSRNNYNKGLFIFDVIHMPPSVCGLWPALWLLGEPEAEWPKYGEVDIIEGVNQQQSNLMTLHTKNDCKIGKSVSITSSDPDAITYTGKRTTTNCNVYAGNGCQIAAPQASSVSDSAAGYKTGATYGSPLNDQGGAVLAVEWTSSGFKVWSWPRNSAPDSVKSATANNPSDISPSSDFGTPVAHFGGASCNWNDNFKDLAFVINTDFCGDWAGNVDWNGGTCTKKTGYQSCSNYVRDHPEAFLQAYWEFGAVRYFAPASSYGYTGTGTGYAGGSAGDGAFQSGSGGYEYDPVDNNSDAQNTTPSSNVQNSTSTPILDSRPTTLLSVPRLSTTPVSTTTTWSQAPSSTDVYNSNAGFAEKGASSDSLLNVTPTPPPFIFTGSSQAESKSSVHAALSVVYNTTTTTLPVCTCTNFSLPVASPRPTTTFALPSYLPTYSNSTTALGLNATASAGSPLTKVSHTSLLSSTATPPRPTATPLVVPVNSAADKLSVLAGASLLQFGAIAGLSMFLLGLFVFAFL